MQGDYKTYKIEARVTKEQKEMIKHKAKENKTTISALILNSIENNITIDLDTSDYRDLVIQTRRIGNNINSIIKDIRFSNYFTTSDMLSIENNLKEINERLKQEKLKINKAKRDFENLTPKQIKNYLEKEEKKIPIFLINNLVIEQITFELRSFIDLINNENWSEVYPPYIEFFLENFDPSEYEYNELVNLSNDLDKVLFKINQKIITRTGSLTKDDFMNVMNVLNIYRKESDE